MVSSSQSVFDAISGFANATERPVRCTYQGDEIIYAERDPARSLFWIERGTVKKTHISAHGKERVVAICKVGEFLGVGCLGRPIRMLNAVSMTACSVVRIEKSVVLRALSEQPTLAERFIAHLIDLNGRYEEDLVGHLFDPIEKRLARVLFVLSDSCEDELERTVPRVSQETLAEMVGATRSRVNYFMNKFRQAGLIDCQKGIRLHPSFLEMVRREGEDSNVVCDFEQAPSVRAHYYLKLAEQVEQRGGRFEGPLKASYEKLAIKWRQLAGYLHGS
jgi:CRP-like cAMP-binding protein